LIDTDAAALSAFKIREDHAAYQKAFAAHKTRREAYIRSVARKEQLVAEIEHLDGVSPPTPPSNPEVTKEELTKLGRKLDEVEEHLRELETAQRDLPDLEKELQDVSRRLPDAVSEETLKLAEKVAYESRLYEKESARLSGVISSTKAALESNMKIIEVAERVEGAARVNEDWLRVLEEAESILHRTAAPASVVRSKLQQLTDRVNNALVSLAADFYVSLDESGNLTPHRNKRAVPRLSGGQTAILALAWRLALSPGLLCLDEPTYGLDEKRIEALRLALDAWRDRAGTNQIIIVTHNNRLASAFDTLVSVA